MWLCGSVYDFCCLRNNEILIIPYWTFWFKKALRASDSESIGSVSDPHRRHHVVSLSKTHKLSTLLVKPRKLWLRPNMSEKLLTGTLSLNTNKQTRKGPDTWKSMHSVSDKIENCFYAPNFEKVGRAYCFGLVCLSVCVCVRLLTFKW